LDSLDQQIRVNKLTTCHASRKRVELRAVADFLEQLFRLIGRRAEDANRAASRLKQSGHQIHQRRLAGAVWSNKARDARRNLQIHTIDAKNLSIEFRDIVENDLIVDC